MYIMGLCQTLTQASKDRMEALRRKLSNVLSSDVPKHPVPGAFSYTIIPGSSQCFGSIVHGFRGHVRFGDFMILKNVVG